jgi:hypothetical protein
MVEALGGKGTSPVVMSTFRKSKWSEILLEGLYCAMVAASVIGLVGLSDWHRPMTLGIRVYGPIYSCYRLYP